MARIACLLVCDFPVAALIRADPELGAARFAIGRTEAPHCELTAVSPRARAVGVRPGMTAAQARTIARDLVVVRASSGAERSAHDALLDVAGSFSPTVEAGEPGCVWLDLAGLGRLFGRKARDAAGGGDEGASGAERDVENAMAAELARRARRLGLEVAVGIAVGKRLAHLAACLGGIRVVAPGEERKFLDWLPLDALDPGEGGDGLALTLRRLGIKRLGDLARLDEREVGSRFGRLGVELLRIARGEETVALMAQGRAPSFAEELELEYGIETLEPLAFVMSAMLERLLSRLELCGLAAGDITLELGLAGRRRDGRRVAVGAETSEVKPLLALLRLSLEAAPPPAPVEAVRLSIEPRPFRPVQADMFAPPCPAPQRLQATLARLAALCGPDQVGALLPRDSHCPEAVRLVPFAPAPRAGPLPPKPPAREVTQLVMRAIRPPAEVEVLCLGAVPEFVRGRDVCARVISLAGPWRRCGQWWREAAADLSVNGDAPPPVRAGRGDGPFNREYYEFVLADGAVYRAFYDLDLGRWFLDGIYD